MGTKVENLALELLGLPMADRALLARQLIQSLDDADSPDSETLWLVEARRRSAQITDETVVCRPAEDVFRQAREDLK